MNLKGSEAQAGIQFINIFYLSFFHFAEVRNLFLVYQK